jgi:glycosyltransferase involved in cell wall biosynthesis
VLAVTVRHPVRMVQCLGIALRTKSRWPLLNLWYASTLAELVRRHDVQFLHAHFAGDAGELAYFASRLTGVRYGLTVHATDIYWNRFLCPKLQEADLVVTVCQYNIGQMVERCPALDRRSIRIKYAGIDAEHFRLPRPRPLRPGRHVVAVGRLHSKKGFDQLVVAMATLRDEGRDVECTIIGEGDEEPKLRALIAEHALDDVVHLAGARRPDEILELLVDADVLAAPCTLAPSGNRDSMPVVIKEAMAMELPVVASDDFGIPEMVTDEVGVLVPRDDPAALAVALADVLDRSPEDRAKMGRAGRERVLEHFHEPALVADLAEQFERRTRGKSRD